MISLGWIGFYGITNIVDYLMPNPLYTYILDIYDLVGLGFMAHLLLLVIYSEIFLFIYIKYLLI